MCKGSVVIQPESIAIVLPVHSRRELTLTCLRALFRQSVAGFKVIVVDSGSTDGTADAVEAEFPNVTVLRHGNLWWSGATNKGVERALAEHAKYVLTINDDLEFAENYLEAMMCAAERHPTALMGSYAFDIKTRQPIYCGERALWALGKAQKLVQTVPEERRRGLMTISYAPARGLWIPAEAFKKIGLIDAERLPHYCADMDFTARAASNGFELFINFDAVLYCHRELSGGSELRTHYSWKNYRIHLFGIQGGGNLKNFTIFAFRHCPWPYLPLYWPIGSMRCAGGYLRDWALSVISRRFRAGRSARAGL
jgi:GT2 family glycosyltransferase